MGSDHVAGWSGECVVVFAGGRLIVACRFTSTTGPTIVLGVGRWARRGLALGSEFAELARSDTGAPLRWSSDADSRCVRWEDRGLELRGTFARLAVPMTVPIRPLQGSLGAGTIPRRVSGRCRFGRVTVAVPSDDALSVVGGHHRAVLVSGPSVVADAVRAARALPSLRPRRRAADPLQPG